MLYLSFALILVLFPYFKLQSDKIDCFVIPNINTYRLFEKVMVIFAIITIPYFLYFVATTFKGNLGVNRVYGV